MVKKKVKRVKKIKLFRIFLLLIGMSLIYLSFSLFLDAKIKNIYVKGNNILTDQEVMVLAKIDNYPSFYWTSSNSIKTKLLKSPYIEKVTVRKNFFHKLTINIVEYKLLFYKKENGKLVLSNKNELQLENIYPGIPSLINYVPDTKYDKFIHEISKFDVDIISKISEIEYVPNEYDKDRFLMYMTDHNRVYLTLSKFDKMNKYDEVLPELDGKTGILYFDSGNHFQAF